MRMVRRGDWKLVYDMMGRGQLYCVANDPAELRDCFDDTACAGVQMELMKDLLAWSIRAEDPLPFPRSRYVVKTDHRNWYSTWQRPHGSQRWSRPAKNDAA
jgi:hypothetical protein